MKERWDLANPRAPPCRASISMALSVLILIQPRSDGHQHWPVGILRDACMWHVKLGKIISHSSHHLFRRGCLFLMSLSVSCLPDSNSNYCILHISTVTCCSLNWSISLVGDHYIFSTRAQEKRMMHVLIHGLANIASSNLFDISVF